MGRTHAAAGLLAGMMASQYCSFDISCATVCCGAAMIGSLIVDLDHHNSMASQASGLLGSMTSHIFTHRGVLHTPLFFFIVNSILLALLYFACPSEVFSIGSTLIIMLSVGELSHLILDSLNPKGIMWLYPCKKRFHIIGIKSGSVFDRVLRWICLLGVVAVAWIYFK